MKKLAFVALAAMVAVPSYITAHNQSNVAPLYQNNGFSIVDECRVPVFHTEFNFPLGGGVIVRTESGNMYFIRTYIPGCEHAGDGYPIVKGSTTSVSQPVYTAPVYTQSIPVATPAPAVVPGDSGCQ